MNTKILEKPQKTIKWHQNPMKKKKKKKKNSREIDRTHHMYSTITFSVVSERFKLMRSESSAMTNTGKRMKWEK